MKILHISNLPLWFWGDGQGMPSVFWPQAEMAKKGHDIFFVCPRKESEAARTVSEGIRVYRFNFPFNFKRNVYIQTDSFFGRVKGSLCSNLNWFFFQIFGFFWGLAIGRRIRPDVVYAHSLTSVLPAYLASRLLSARFIIRVYGTRQLYWRWDCFWYRLKEFRDYLTFKIPADYFIINNDGNGGDRLARKLGVPDEKIKYWRNGISDFFYEPVIKAKEELCQALKIDPALKIIASTCRLIPDYRVDQLIYALVKLYKMRTDAVCLIAGEGPQYHFLKALVSRYALSSRVFFLGIVNRQMIRKILSAADIFVLLARYHSGSNTVLEAMAAGRCIITTATPFASEFLSSGDNCVLVSPDRLEAVPRILQECLDNDMLRATMGGHARSKARQILETWEHRTARELRLLEELLSLRKTQRS